MQLSVFRAAAKALLGQTAHDRLTFTRCVCKTVTLDNNHFLNTLLCKRTAEELSVATSCLLISLRWLTPAVSHGETMTIQSMMSSAWLSLSRLLQWQEGHPVRKPWVALGTCTSPDSPWQVQLEVASQQEVWEGRKWHTQNDFFFRSSGWRPHTTSLHPEDCSSPWWPIQHHIVIVNAGVAVCFPPFNNYWFERNFFLFQPSLKRCTNVADVQYRSKWVQVKMSVRKSNLN